MELIISLYLKRPVPLMITSSHSSGLETIRCDPEWIVILARMLQQKDHQPNNRMSIPILSRNDKRWGFGLGNGEGDINTLNAHRGGQKMLHALSWTRKEISYRKEWDGEVNWPTLQIKEAGNWYIVNSWSSYNTYCSTILLGFSYDLAS